MSCRNHAFSSSLRFNGFEVDEEINYTMDGTPQDRSNGYRCNISGDANNNGTLRRIFFDSMSEGMNEEGNGYEEQEQGDNENRGKNFTSHQKVGLLGDV